MGVIPIIFSFFALDPIALNQNILIFGGRFSSCLWISPDLASNLPGAWYFT
jgi:hypothetical protein